MPTAHENYKDIIRRVAKDVCENHPFPKLADYEKAVYREKIKEPYYASYIPEEKDRVFHSSTVRAMQALVESKEFFCFSDRHYYPATPEYRRRYYKLKLIGSVRFGRRDIHLISPNTCAITMDDIPDENTIVLIKEFIGLNCYSVTPLGNLLIVMLTDNIDSKEELTTLKHISDMISEAYDNNPKIKIKTKMKKNTQQAAVEE